MKNYFVFVLVIIFILMKEKKTFGDAIKDGTLTLNPPISEKELKEIVDKLEIKPSDGLMRIWKKVGKGFCPDFAISFQKPGELTTLKEDDCDYEGYKKVIGKKVFYVGNVYDGTDSNTRVYEIAEGDDKGLLISLSYGDLSVYKSKIDLNQLLDIILKVDYDVDDICINIFDAIATDKITDDDDKKKK